MKKTLTIATTAAALFAAVVVANPVRDSLLAGYAAQAGVSGFSAEAGQALFLSQNTGGKEATPSCTSCHTNNPATQGRTRVGKVIEPMAVSANPERFTDPEKVEKWFRRNCTSVLGRECTAEEKGNFLTFMISQ
jgi:cytochrome c peroxidase